MIPDWLPAGPYALVTLLVAAAAVAVWLHHLGVAKAIAAPLLRKHREQRITSRTESLQRRAWDLSEHDDERDLDARLADALGRTPELDDAPEMVLPGVEATRQSGVPPRR